MKFLIADDYSIIRKMLTKMLLEEFPSAEIIEAKDGNEVLEHLDKHIWDVILLDISMPGPNGIETLKNIKAKGIKAPVLMISTHSADQYAAGVLQAGASGFLNKDNLNEEFVTAIHTVLSGKKYITSAS